MKTPSDQVSPFGLSEPKIAYRIDEFVHASGIGRTGVYEALKNGRLKGVKAGNRTLILGDSGREFIASLPAYRPQSDQTVT